MGAELDAGEYRAWREEEAEAARRHALRLLGEGGSSEPPSVAPGW